MIANDKDDNNSTLRILLSFFSKYTNKKILVVMLIVIALLVSDIAFGKIYDLVNKQSVYASGVALFIAIASAFVIGQYFILGFIKQKSEGIISKEKTLNTMQRAVTTVQYVLSAILILMIFQVASASNYNVAMLIVTITISYTLATAMMGLLSYRFFSWFKLNKNFVVMLYGIASAAIAVTAGLTFIFMDFTLLNQPQDIGPQIQGLVPAYGTSSVTGMLNYAFFISSMVSFMITWGTTSQLLRHYSQKLGRTKYWIIASIPLVFFLTQFISYFLKLLSPLISINPIFFIILFTLIFSLSLPIGGIMFGIAFWTMARRLHDSNIVRDYMIISACGLVLFFVSSQTNVIQIQYTPFGLATTSFEGLASYLVFIGLYSASTSVSQDIKLRQTIRKSANEESKLLDSIATAQMEQEIERRVLRVAIEQSEKMKEETGIETSLSQEDAKEYLEEVLNEIKTFKHRI